MATEFLASSAWWLVHKGNKEDVGDVRWHVKGLQKLQVFCDLLDSTT